MSNKGFEIKRWIDTSLDLIAEAHLPAGIWKQALKGQGDLGLAYMQALDVMTDEWSNKKEDYEIMSLIEAPDAAYIQQYWYPSWESVSEHLDAIKNEQEEKRNIRKELEKYLKDIMEEDYDYMTRIELTREWANKALKNRVINGTDYSEEILLVAGLIAAYTQ